MATSPDANALHCTHARCNRTARPPPSAILQWQHICHCHCHLQTIESPLKRAYIRTQAPKLIRHSAHTGSLKVLCECECRPDGVRRLPPNRLRAGRILYMQMLMTSRYRTLGGANGSQMVIIFQLNAPPSFRTAPQFRPRTSPAVPCRVRTRAIDLIRIRRTRCLESALTVAT